MRTCSSRYIPISTHIPTFEDRVTIIRQCPVFADLPEPDIQYLAAQAGIVEFSQGQALSHRGQKTEYALLVVQGVVRLSLSSPSGQEFILGIAGRSMLIGEWILDKDQRQPLDLIAHESVIALRLPRDLLLGVEDELSLARAFNQMMTERLLDTLQSLEDLALFSLRPRLARLLARMHCWSESCPAARLHRYNQNTLALMSGGTRSRVNEHLQYFRQLGVIDIHCGSVLVREPGQLAQLGNEPSHDRARNRPVRTNPIAAAAITTTAIAAAENR